MKAREEPANLKDSVLEVVKVIRRHDSFVLLEHQKPDGDCVGSVALVQPYDLVKSGPACVR